MGVRQYIKKIDNKVIQVEGEIDWEANRHSNVSVVMNHNQEYNILA